MAGSSTVSSTSLSKMITQIMSQSSGSTAAASKTIRMDTDQLVAGANTLSAALKQISDLFTYLGNNIPTFTKAEAADDYTEAITSISTGIEGLSDVLQWTQDTYNNFAYIEAILQGTDPSTFSYSKFGITDATKTLGSFAGGANVQLGDEASTKLAKSASVGVSATAFEKDGWKALTASAGAKYELGALGASASAYAAAALFEYSTEVGFSEYDKWELGANIGGAKAEGKCMFSLTDDEGNFMPGIGADVGASIWAAKTEVSVHAGYGGENNNLIGGFVNGELEAGSATAEATARLGMDDEHNFACVLGAEASLIAVKAGLAGGITVLGTDIGAGVEAVVGLEAKGKFGYSDGKFEIKAGLAVLIGLEVDLVIDLSDTVETVKGIWDDVESWCKSTVSKAGDALETAGNAIKNAVTQTVDKVKSTAQTIAKKTQETATELYEEAKRIAEEAKRKAEEEAARLAAEAKKKAEEAKKEAERLAAEAKKKAEEEANKAKQWIKDTTNKVADTVKSAAKKVANFFKKW